MATYPSGHSSAQEGIQFHRERGCCPGITLRAIPRWQRGTSPPALRRRADGDSPRRVRHCDPLGERTPATVAAQGVNQTAGVTSGSGFNVLHSHVPSAGRRRNEQLAYTGEVSFRPGPRSAARQALRLVALVVTLAGLFGMHGLAEHGTEQMGGAPAAMSTMAIDAATPAAHLTQATVATFGPVFAANVSHRSGGGTGMDMNAAAMCLAVLLLTLIAMIVHLHASRLRPLLISTDRPVRAPVTSRREPDPPNLYALSIQRC